MLSLFVQVYGSFSLLFLEGEGGRKMDCCFVPFCSLRFVEVESRCAFRFLRDVMSKIVIVLFFSGSNNAFCI